MSVREVGGDPTGGSVSYWIEGIKQGDEEAARKLLERYFDQVVGLARRRIDGAKSLRIADEEDVAIEAFQSVCRAAAAGRLSDLFDRDSLWKLLVATAYRKIADYWREQHADKRGAGNVIHLKSPQEDSHALGIEAVAIENITGELLSAIADQHSFLMAKLRERGSAHLDVVADLMLQGYTNQEIAAELECTERTVERKRKLIREIARRALGDTV